MHGNGPIESIVALESTAGSWCSKNDPSTMATGVDQTHPQQIQKAEWIGTAIPSRGRNHSNLMSKSMLGYLCPSRSRNARDNEVIPAQLVDKTLTPFGHRLNHLTFAEIWAGPGWCAHGQKRPAMQIRQAAKVQNEARTSPSKNLIVLPEASRWSREQALCRFIRACVCLLARTTKTNSHRC
jgi:hypothetical protein